eukprot:TRINITY_DN7171_c0_g1_i1.p1 TRINITY_DN7171_c0_g1~~TRINITY_DN7171_c0_g1_i1.p1  ORF type:complete len:474 (+),score=85.35 TRINITY_DN7171_c0_g1_i1:64-1422(+)
MKIRHILAYLTVFASLAIYLYINASPYYLFTCSYINFPHTYCPKQTEIKGEVKHGFEPIKEKFSAQFSSGQHTAAQLEIFQNGETVVQLYGGEVETDPLLRNKQQLTPSMVIPIYSSGKIVESLVMAILEDRGLINYTEKISTYWPEFAQNGKENITIEILMKHQAGLLKITPKISVSDQGKADLLSSVLSQQRPSCYDQQCYHPFTRGLYVDQIVRRVDPKHRSFSQFAKEEIIDKLGGDVKYSLGTSNFPESEIALTVPFPTLRIIAYFLPRLLPMWIQDLFLTRDNTWEIAKEMFFPVNGSCVSDSFEMIEEIKGRGPSPVMNDPIWRVQENPSYSTVTNAHSLARIAQILLGAKDQAGNEVLSPQAIKRATRFDGSPVFDGWIKLDVQFSPAGLGDITTFFHSKLGPLIGWKGSGGSFIFVLPSRKVVFSYIPVASTYKYVDDRAIEL